MKIAVSGKGGVGKTSITGILAQALVQKGLKVLAIDADPNPNLALTLGIPIAQARKIVPISQNMDLIEEKTGVRPNDFRGLYRLSFTVNDIFDKFSIRSPSGVNLLVMGTVGSAGSGCMCPANALIRALLRHLLMKKDHAVVVDMEAGTEHLGRGTSEFIDVMIVVTEPSVKALETTKKIFDLSTQLGIPQVLIVGNKVTSFSDEAIILQFCKQNDLSLLELVPYDENIKQADALGKPLMNFSQKSKGILAIQKMCTKIVNLSHS